MTLYEYWEDHDQETCGGSFSCEPCALAEAYQRGLSAGRRHEERMGGYGPGVLQDAFLAGHNRGWKEHIA